MSRNREKEEKENSKYQIKSNLPQRKPENLLKAPEGKPPNLQ